MADYVIRVDSATKPTKPTRTSSWRSKSGKSTASWTIHVGQHILGAGIIYYNYNGPNKTIYEGILAALCKFEFLYQNEDNAEYKKVDKLSEVGRDWIQKMLKNS